MTRKSHNYTFTSSFLSLLPLIPLLLSIREPQIELPVLHSNFSSTIHFTQDSVFKVPCFEYSLCCYKLSTVFQTFNYFPMKKLILKFFAYIFTLSVERWAQELPTPPVPLMPSFISSDISLLLPFCCSHKPRFCTLCTF